MRQSLRSFNDGDIPLRVILNLLLIFIVLIAGCAGSGSTSTVTASEQKKSINDQEKVNHKILDSLQSRRYADAIQLSRTAGMPKAETDFAVGEIILQGLADPDATQYPVESFDDGLALIEGSAMAGHRQAISSLAATFYTGIRQGREGVVLIAPNPQLSECWNATKVKKELASSCVQMRLKK